MVKEEDKGKAPSSESAPGNKDASCKPNGESAPLKSVEKDVSPQEPTVVNELKRETNNEEGKSKEKVEIAQSKKPDGMGMIFLCNAKTKQDCYRYNVLGMPGSKKAMVSKIYKGMRLFLFDIDLRLLYGIYKAASPGGYNIEPKAFNSAFPSQVRFTVFDDCLPLAEEKFKAAIKDNYYGTNKFTCELKPEQVKNLCKLFRVVGGQSKQVSRGTESHYSVADQVRDTRRDLDKMSLPPFSGDRPFPMDGGMYEREPISSSMLPPQLPTSLPPAYSYEQPLTIDYHKTDTSRVDHNRWILEMELKRQELEVRKNQEPDNMRREHPPYHDSYIAGLQSGVADNMRREHPPYHDSYTGRLQSGAPDNMRREYPPYHDPYTAGLQSGAADNMQREYAPYHDPYTAGRQSGAPDYMQRENPPYHDPYTAGLQSGAPDSMQREYPPYHDSYAVGQQSGYHPPAITTAPTFHDPMYNVGLEPGYPPHVYSHPPTASVAHPPSLAPHPPPSYQY